MNLYEISNLLRKKGKAVFSINEIARELNKPKNVVSVYVNRMTHKGMLWRIERNKVSLEKDVFIIASQIVFPSYISLTSALYLHNVIPQVVNKIYMISSKKKRRLKFETIEIDFINTKPEFMFGYKKIKKGHSFIILADLEKAIIDSIHFFRYCRLHYIINALKKADIDKLEEYIKFSNNEAIRRRVGYLLDIIGIKHKLKRETNVSYKLNPSLKRKGKFNKKWYLYINENVS